MENSVKQMSNWYHKLIYIIVNNEQIQSIVDKFENSKKININKLLSEKLLEIPKQKYPMFVYDILLEALRDKDDLYILQHIDILFDPQSKHLITNAIGQKESMHISRLLHQALAMNLKQ
ncbi:hypothetical protein HNQ35_002784, partial [Cerasibacillus quisquiliarum]|nr:hypothetical protein [Cerasibacillus quisquiliarum]